MFWTKKLRDSILISDYLDLKNQDLLDVELKFIDHNDMIFIYKKEIEVPQYGIYFTQYYFKTNEHGIAIKLTKENLIKYYSNTGCILELKVFLNSNKVIDLNEFGHLLLFDIINFHSEKKSYQLLQFEVMNEV